MGGLAQDQEGHIHCHRRPPSERGAQGKVRQGRGPVHFELQQPFAHARYPHPPPGITNEVPRLSSGPRPRAYPRPIQQSLESREHGGTTAQARKPAIDCHFRRARPTEPAGATDLRAELRAPRHGQVRADKMTHG